jgi:hypothetical protein
MSVVTTYYKTGATFDAHNGGRTNIGHIMAPFGALDTV